MCGESLMSRPTVFRPIGSPPHVWGKLSNLKHDSKFFRITPTCVGKAIHAGVLRAVYGITPTCVGKAFRFSVSGHCVRDHPHMCGESF